MLDLTFLSSSSRLAKISGKEIPDMKKSFIAIGGLFAFVFGLVPLSFSSQLPPLRLREKPLTGSRI